MSEAVEKTIVGRCAEISEKNGWTTFHVDVGSQYPVRLQTKLPAVIEEGRSVGDAEASWTFKESQGSENPNRPGTFYMNRYLGHVVIGAVEASAAQASQTPAQTTAAPQGGAPAQTGAHPALPSGDKDRAITRMACLKAAAQVYQGRGEGRTPNEYGMEDDAVVADVIAAAGRLEQWVMRDLDDVPF